MNKLLIAVLLVLVVVAITATPAHAAQGVEVIENSSWDVAGHGHWISLDDLPGLPGWFYVPQGCSIGAAFDETTNAWSLIGMCE